MKVSVIIPTCRNENQSMLDDCLESVDTQTHTDLETIVVSSCTELTQVKEHHKLIQFDHRLTFPEAINIGVAKSDPNTDYYFLLNDDVILSWQAIHGLVEFIGHHPGLVGVTSNCDNGWYYHGDFEIQNETGCLPNKTQYSREEILPFKESIINRPLGMKVGIQVPYLCFYGTLIPKKVWDAVGKLDERYKAGYEDQDYCIRARKLGMMCFVTFRSFALHLGGKTSSVMNEKEETARSREVFVSTHPGEQTP